MTSNFINLMLAHGVNRIGSNNFKHAHAEDDEYTSFKIHTRLRLQRQSFESVEFSLKSGDVADVPDVFITITEDKISIHITSWISEFDLYDGSFRDVEVIVDDEVRFDVLFTESYALMIRLKDRVNHLAAISNDPSFSLDFINGSISIKKLTLAIRLTDFFHLKQVVSDNLKHLSLCASRKIRVSSIAFQESYNISHRFNDIMKMESDFVTTQTMLEVWLDG